MTQEEAKYILEHTVISWSVSGSDAREAIQMAIKELKRKKGKWVLHPEVKNIYGGIYIECSECHTKYVVQHIEDEKYCRNCGAEMRGEEE